MKRSVFVAVAAVAAAAAIGAGGAAGANTGLRTLQATSGTTHECTGTYMETVMSQTCTTAGNDVVCVLKTDSREMTQTCNVTQTGATNRAKIVQVATTNKGPSPQNHTQIVHVTQGSSGGSNWVDVTQVVKQSLGPGHYDDTDESEPESASTTIPGPIETQQDFHQLVTVDQTAAGAGNNSSKISQFGKQRARAKQALSISQNQNTLPGSEVCPADDPAANMCSVVNQTSGTGQNVSTLDDMYLQFARAHKTMAAGTQQQGAGPGAGGIDHEIHQTSDGFCKITTKQSERQVLRAVHADETQIQNGPTRKGFGSAQDCGSDAVWTGTQDSTQLATDRKSVV